MFTFLKKRIIVDTNNEEVTRVIAILEKNKIKYELRTTRSRGVFGTGFDAQSYARANVSMYKGSSQPSFIYMIYVNRRNYTRAKQLISTKS